MLQSSSCAAAAMRIAAAMSEAHSIFIISPLNLLVILASVAVASQRIQPRLD
jgi:hypothetical protein